MTQPKINALLHPVRMRILQTLAGGRQLTAAQISERLPDIAPATLYRHLKTLTGLSALRIVAEQQVRGTVERVYALPADGRPVSTSELSAMSPQEHFDGFLAFLMHLLDDFGRYVSQDSFDVFSDGVSYSQAVLYMDDDELAELASGIGSLLNEALRLEPRPGRRKRTLSLVVVPQVEMEKQPR